jgi:hypothetical protein
MDTNVNTDANVNQAVWNAISQRLALGLGTLLQQASASQRREYAVALFKIYTDDTPELWRPSIFTDKKSVQEIIEASGDDVSIDAFDRLIADPAAETTENRSLKAILPPILKVPKEHLFAPAFRVSQRQTVSRRDPSTKPLSPKRSKKDWALLFSKKYPDLWADICKSYRDKNPHMPEDEGVIYTWLEVETGRKANAEIKSVEHVFKALLDGSVNTTTLDKYMQVLYAIAEVELPDIYTSKKPIRRTPQEWADEFARNQPELWKGLSNRYQETFPDKDADGVAIYKWIETTLSQKACPPPPNVEQVLKGFIRQGLGDRKGGRYLSILLEMAGLPALPSAGTEQIVPKAVP